MLKSRIWTALCLILFIVLSIVYFPNWAIAIIAGGVFILGLYEWFHLVGYRRFPPPLVLITAFIKWLLITFVLIPLLLMILISALYYYGLPLFGPLDWSGPANLQMPLLILLTLGIWIVAFLDVLMYPRGIENYTKGEKGLIVGFYVLIPACFSIVYLQGISPKWALYPLVLVWAADIGAYILGKWLGRHKCAPKVSPGKTWEGIIGGFLAGFLVASLGFYYLNIKLPFTFWMGFNAIIIFFSIVGDLFESLFKRVHQLKDSGRLLPGHGGILDRIDSLTAALPIFAVLGRVLEIFYT